MTAPLTTPSARGVASGDGVPFPTRRDVWELRWAPRWQRDGVLNLKSCELRHPTASRLVRAAADRLTPDDLTCYPYQQALLADLRDHHGHEPSGILLTAGSDSAVGLVVDALAAGGAGLILHEPTFESWRYYAALRAVPVVGCAALDAGAARLDVSRLHSTMADHPPAVVVVTNPGSPSGLLLSPEQIAETAEAARRAGHLLVIDECYGAFTGVTHVPLVASAPHLLVVCSYSKTFGLAGARVASVLGSPALVAYLSRFRPDSTVSATALALLRAVLRERDAFAEVWRDVRAIRSAFVRDVLAGHPGWSALDPGGNYVTFRTGDRAVPGRMTRHLDDHDVRVRPLDGIPGLEGCLRVSLADAPAMRRVAALMRDVR
ncbi:histidinol-phosphate aminotransferase family protein [Actinomadura graeca]|uniref:Aminotransferase n=1 Tax=Actinomadura graeca TaxID=2750812 RepID=A0ABX8R3P8_9ACTN|nr:aminotransferase class I/II-fold pyridoxal phosphate-dependent enzyme [Actinomadura graeca]QXJ25686.1 histidinol-phosphate aminotransferase family protein [Actinomadura graeca]